MAAVFVAAVFVAAVFVAAAFCRVGGGRWLRATGDDRVECRRRASRRAMQTGKHHTSSPAFRPSPRRQNAAATKLVPFAAERFLR